MHRTNPVLMGIGSGLVAGSLVFGIAACGNDEEENTGPDLGNTVEDPTYRDLNKIEVYGNVEGYPSLVRACIDGVAVAFTPEYNSVIRIPEWDALYCAEPSIPATERPVPSPLPSP